MTTSTDPRVAHRQELFDALVGLCPEADAEARATLARVVAMLPDYELAILCCFIAQVAQKGMTEGQVLRFHRGT